MNSPGLGPLLHALYRSCGLNGGDARTDADLLERFTRAHDQEAFATLVQRHGPMVLAVCRRLLPDRHEAEDAFQATFLVLVRKSSGLRQPQHLAPWLHGVARRVAARLRQRATRRHSVPDGLDLAEARDLGPLERLTWQEVRTILDEEIERLPSKYRLPVILCYLQGQSYTEVARSLGWPAGTVSVRLARAREKLRARFVRRGLGVSASLPGSLQGTQALAAAVPTGLLTATVKAGVCLGAGTPGLAGVVSQHVIALAEGVLQTMWLTKLKTTLFVVLIAGLVCAGLGGLAWQPGPQAQAQDPRAGGAPERTRAQPDLEPGKELDDIERQLKELQDQVQAKQRQLYRLRQGNALDQIEAALKKLKQANADEPQRRAAIEEFEQAFAKLKQALGGIRTTLRVDYTDRVRLTLDTTKMPIVSDGRVLQVDLENKQVLLSTGSKDGVKNGQLYRAYQGDKASPDQTGWIRITQTEAKWSLGTILQEYSPRAPMRPGDNLQRHDGKEPEGMRGAPARQ